MNEYENNTNENQKESISEIPSESSSENQQDIPEASVSDEKPEKTEKNPNIASEISSEDTSPEHTADVIPAEEETSPVAEEKLPPVYHWNYDEQKNITDTENKKNKKNATLIYALAMTAAFIICFAVLVGLLLGGGFLYGSEISDTSSDGEIIKDTVVYVRDNTNGEGAMSTQEIYSSVLPAVVSLSTYNDTTGAVGTGFIISSDGYIVTANHVIDGMTRIIVKTVDDRKFNATVIGGNAFTDIALIKVDAENLPTVKIGKSSDMLVGDRVFAIGTPVSVDFEGSMTEGILSYNNRILDIKNSETGTVEKKMTVIQTDALLNPGNSGCPLINAYGEVVGIVTMKLNSTYYDAICFALPIDAAMPIVNAMKNGENYDNLLSAISRYPAKLGITAKNAVISGTDIYGVEIDSFAEGYDIVNKMKVGDLIVKIDSISVTSLQDVSQALDYYEPGDTVKISFYRASQLMSVNVVLGK